jgi:hypothetical protein
VLSRFKRKTGSYALASKPHGLHHWPGCAVSADGGKVTITVSLDPRGIEGNVLSTLMPGLRTHFCGSIKGKF